jgi:AhpD family alkylhydroperoxidase
MARIALKTGGGLVARIINYFARQRLGRVPEPLQVMAHHPRLLGGYAMFELAAGECKLVPSGLKELATIKVAALVGCEFCLDIASLLARHSGVTDQQLRELHCYSSSDHFSRLEKLVLDYAVSMSRTPAVIADELFDALRREFSEAQLVELTAVIALENHRARFNHAFGIKAQGFSNGDYCARPELPAAAAVAVPAALT